MADVVHVLFGESLSSHDLGELTLFSGVVYVGGAIGAIANPTLFTTSIETQLHKKNARTREDMHTYTLVQTPGRSEWSLQVTSRRP